MNIVTSEMMAKAFWPVNCAKCGRTILESYKFAEVTPNGDIGFTWCGWCRTKRMIPSPKEHSEATT